MTETKIRHLMGAFHDSECYANEQVRLALSKMGGPAVVPLIRLLEDEEPLVRGRDLPPVRECSLR